MKRKPMAKAKLEIPTKEYAQDQAVYIAAFDSMNHLKPCEYSNGKGGELWKTFQKLPS